MARRIPLPRLTRRQRSARWQRERRQQAIYVIVFSALLFFVLGLAAWAATDRYYKENLKPAAQIYGRSIAYRDYQRELRYQLDKFYVDFGVPPGFEDDRQLAADKAIYPGEALNALLEQAVLDRAATTDRLVVQQAAILERYGVDYGAFRTRHILLRPDEKNPDKDAADKAALAKAQDVALQLKAAPNDQALWTKLATEVSGDTPTKDKGGELGFVFHDQFQREFEDAVRKMKVGDVSDPVKTAFGYHVIQLEELRGPEGHDYVKRWLADGLSTDDIYAHVRYTILKDEYTRRAQEAVSTTTTAEQVHLRKIVVNTPSPASARGDISQFSAALKKLGDVQRAIDSGESFDLIATKLSDDEETKSAGGEIGWFARGQLGDAVAEKDVFAKEAGGVVRRASVAQTTFYKIVEKDAARALTDAQQTEIKEQAYAYWLAQQKLAGEAFKLVPGYEVE